MSTLAETPIADGISILEAVSEMPQHKTKRYNTRPLEGIIRTYLHHSGRLGAPGLQGAINSANYVVNHRDWAGGAYHLWAPFDPFLSEESGDLLCIRMQPAEVRCYHTGGVCNTHGYGVVLQGNTSTNGMSPSQEELMEAIQPHLAEEFNYGYEDIGGHFEAKKFGAKKNKSSCPGKAGRKWLEDYRRDALIE